MRICHAPINSAGQATAISRAQRKLGHKSDVVVYYETNFNYENDLNMHTEKYPKYIRELVMLWTFLKCLFKYDIFHFHCGVTFLPRNIDLYILKLLGKKIVMEYWGSDVMQLDVARDYTLWTDKELKTVYPNINDEIQRQKIARFEKLTDRTIVSLHALLPFSPNSIPVRTAVNLSKCEFVGVKPRKDSVVNIVHAPTNRVIKGTKDILNTISKLKKDGYKINLILVEGKSNKEAIEDYKKADIVVDEIRQGPYGSLAIECMSLGKPVICYRDPKLEKYYEDCPVINANKDTLYQALVRLIKSPRLCQDIGKESRKFVETHHDSKKIARQLIKIYENL